MSWYLNKIPKICHMYWGGNSLPYMRYLSILSFKKFNPDWTIKLFTPFKVFEKDTWSSNEHRKVNKNVKDYFPELLDKGIEIIKMQDQQYGIQSNISEVFKSDLLRLHALAEYGGVWSDTDILYFKSIENMELNQEKYKNMNMALCIHNRCHKIGFYFAEKENPFFMHTKGHCKEFLYDQSYQSVGANYLNARWKEIEQVASTFKLAVGNIPEITVYPYLYDNICWAYEKNEFKKWLDTPTCIGIHWFGGDCETAKFINILTDENLHEHNNTITCAMQYIRDYKEATNECINSNGIL